MAEKFNTEDLTAKELAKHLRQPTGSQGKKIGMQMNKGNKEICLNSYKVLKPKDHQSILEIGMGNGFFVEGLLSMANDLKYVGADFSAVMVEEAQKINGHLKSASFVEASVEELPFPNNEFDLITTTNTIYFWPNLEQNIKEVLRVLRPNGKLLIAYRSKSFMDQLELSNYGFNKFESNDIENLLSEHHFKNIETVTVTEPELEFDHKVFSMEGLYTIGFK
ncbi:class I SAM-dependent methyltransferase [Wenyingzhuangia sp. IMCC45533]